jgi:hypothetical protein
MTFRISQQGKEYLDTGRTLLRAAQTMMNQRVADQLRALAEDYERRAEKARTLTQLRHWPSRLLAVTVTKAR